MAGGGPRVRARVMLDTTYLLPTLGVQVDGVDRALELLRRARRRGLVELYYSDFSLLEACAKAAKLDVPLGLLEVGITAITASYTRAAPSIGSWLLAVRLRRDGLRDFIDAILYATAVVNGLRLLTRDERLVSLLEQKGYPLHYVMLEHELEKLAAASP